MKIQIAGEPQVQPCEKCGIAGYQVSELMQAHFTSCYYPEGEREMSYWSDYQRELYKVKKICCGSCGETLKGVRRAID